MMERSLRRNARTAVAAIAAVLFVAGCSSTAPRAGARVVSPGLVMTAPYPHVQQSRPSAAGVGWEANRHDGSLGVGRFRGNVEAGAVEVRTYDRRRTSNGHVTESSQTTTRTIRRSYVR